MGSNVLVTGAGGPAGVGVMRALIAAGHRVTAADSDADAVGFAFADAALLPRAHDPAFIEALCCTALDVGADTLVCTLEEEMLVLCGAEATLDDVGLRSWLPSADAIRVCADKWAFSERLAAAGASAPATGLGTADGVPGPWIVKPRFGRGSRDVCAVDSEDELDWALRRVPRAIVQTRMSGREFTSDALVDRSGSVAGAVHRWRLETRGGISTKGETFLDDRVTALVADVLAAVGLSGPACVQGFVDDDGRVACTEVNARFSGGLPLSLAAGADLVGEYVRGVQGLPVRSDRLRARPGVRMVRCFQDVFRG